MTTINVKVNVDPSTPYSLASSLRSQKQTIDTAVDDTLHARSTILSEMDGTMSSTAAEALADRNAALRGLSSDMHNLTSALDTFASTMGSVKERLLHARGEAQEADLDVSGDTITSPGEKDPDYDQKQEKFNEISDTVDSAREDEAEAHEALQSACADIDMTTLQKVTAVTDIAGYINTALSQGLGALSLFGFKPEINPKVGRFFTRASTAVSAIGGLNPALRRYQEDLLKHPDMSQAKRIQRAGIQALAEAGLPIGLGALGSLVGPEGTAAGAVLGGLIAEYLADWYLEDGGKTARSIGNGVQTAGQWAQDGGRAANSGLQIVGDVANSTAQAVGDAANGAAQATGDVANSTAQAVGDAARTVLPGPVGTMAEDAADAAGNTARNAADAAGNAAKNATETAGNTARNAADAAGNAAKNATETAGNAARNAADAAGNAVEALGDGAKAAGDAAAAVGKAVDATWFM